MHHDPDSPPARVPARALVISCAALVVPLYAGIFAPEAARELEILLWLLALVPAFLLAYYRGWSGATLSLAAGMGVLALTHASMAAVGSAPVRWPLLLMTVIAYIAVTLGVGWLSELLHRQRARVERLALTDELTALANRRHARAVLERDFAAAQRGRPLAVALFDLDHFKQYNDRHGHAAGDVALRSFAAILRQTTRQMNLSARYGGEEFLSILSDIDGTGALAFAERVRLALRADGPPGRHFTFSAGIAVFTPAMRSADDLLAAADAALYEAKQGGRDRVVLAARETRTLVPGEG
jgi:diguanylate cyclase (GGDEF)-like protein